MKANSTPRPVVLCVLDGWGYREDGEDNAIALARTPAYDRMVRSCPFALLHASERHVGLPDGQMGNSEVGHMNIGAGRVVMQELPRIDAAVADGSLVTNAAVTDLVTRLRASGGTCHLMGLVSPGGVHAHQSHVAALARIVAKAGVPVALHAFLDGRDTPPRSARDSIDWLTREIAGLSGVRIATVCGRYYAMDRDKRWDRVSRAYDLFVDGVGTPARDAAAAVDAAYAQDESDEFVTPRILPGYAGMRDGDGVLMANFRTDRAREILAALLARDFEGFPRTRVVRFAAAAGMVEYSDDLAPLMSALFPAQRLGRTMGEVVAAAGRRQLRIAETEKYAHVTFFFNGGEERTFDGEDRILVPSPKVATYDLQPEMAAVEVTDKLVAAIGSGTFDFILVNYANGDMVGHTGNLAAAMVAAETVDACLARIEDAVVQVGGTMLVTADHGNAERMSDPNTGQAHTAHTMDRVPAILVNAPPGIGALADGVLADIAPTLLALMHLPCPAEMTGSSLLRQRSRVPATTGDDHSRVSA
jgi:2,3-bisphosphoglycerate-independent phosphoglycerate mutase